MELQRERERIVAQTAPQAPVADVSTATAGIRALLDSTAHLTTPPVAQPITNPVQAPNPSTPPVVDPRQGGEA